MPADTHNIIEVPHDKHPALPLHQGRIPSVIKGQMDNLGGKSYRRNKDFQAEFSSQFRGVDGSQCPNILTCQHPSHSTELRGLEDCP
jgi:hypothetical protein